MNSLSKSEIGQKLIIDHIDQSAGELESRLMYFGFLPETAVTIIHKAPLFHDPIIVEIDGQRVAIGKREAEKILVK